MNTNTAITIIAVAPTPPCPAWEPVDVSVGMLTLTACILPIIFALKSE